MNIENDLYKLVSDTAEELTTEKGVLIELAIEEYIKNHSAINTIKNTASDFLRESKKFQGNGSTGGWIGKSLKIEIEKFQDPNGSTGGGIG